MNQQSTTTVLRQKQNRTALVVLLIAFALCTGYAASRWQAARHSQLRPMSMDGDWLCSAGMPGYAGYFRKRVVLPGTVRNAWIAVAACDAFEVAVNGNPIGRQYLWRPTRPFQNGLSEKGQRVTSPQPAMALNFPREYQWEGHDSYRLPLFVDIANELQPGENVISVELESRRAPARFCLDGAITLASGQVISINSDSSWKGEPVPPGLQQFDWTHPNYDDRVWRSAQSAQAPPGRQFRTFDPRLYATEFRGQWLRHPQANGQQALWFETSWNLTEQPEDAWLRLAVNRHCTLFVNDQRVETPAMTRADLATGDWVMGTRRAWDLPATPELLDPDEVGSIFAGQRFHSPRHGDPTADSLAMTENVLNRTRDKARMTTRSAMPGTYDPKRSLEETRRTPGKPYAFPEAVTPKALTRDRAVGGLLGWNLTNLLQAGENRIAIRVCAPLSVESLGWAAQMAADGEATLVSGDRVRLDPLRGWTATIENTDTIGVPAEAVESAGPVVIAGKPIPRLQYLGIAPPQTLWTSQWPTLSALSLLVMSVLLAIAHFSGRLIRRFRFADVSGDEESNRVVYGLLTAPTAVLLTAILVECVNQERHEILWFMQESTWQAIVLLAAGLTLLVGLIDLAGRIGLHRARSRGHLMVFAIQQLPQTTFWKFAILWVLLLAGFLRVYQLDFQPLDDDEYASTQAILAIAETGVPGFVPDNVWYTRSPLFHYVMGGIVAVFGDNLWSMRLPTALFGIATCWLTYLCGSRLLRRPWIGMGAMLLVAIHPFEVYTGHIIRFYQMQQFFALLTLYCFCRGFVEGQTQRWRYATVACFLAAVLSQEISAVMGAPLLVGYLLFSKDKGWSANSKLAVISICALAIIVLDYLAFQTRCLTRVEGVSSSLEAAVNPHFWQPYNFLALYIGYSRLHVLPSLFLLLGIPFIWRERNRNTIALHFMLLSGVVLTNLLVTHVSLRYQYWLIPLWILLSLDGLRAVLIRVSALAYDPLRNRNRHLATLGLSTAVVFTGVILSWAPWRMPGSYDCKILGDSTGAFQYVRSQLRDGDVIAATEPHTHAGVVEVGQIDFDISVPLLYDFAVLQEGRLVDRNGGAEVVSSLDQFFDVCRRHERCWVLINREKFRSRGKNLRWEYPGARFELFLRKNLELRHRSYLWSVYLWDANRGFYIPFREDEA